MSADVGGASAASGARGAPRCSPVYCLLSQLAAFGSQAAALQLIFPLLAAISFTLPRATATCNLQLADVSPHFALFFIDRQRQQSRGGDAEQEQLLESTSSSSELVACGNIRSTCGLCHTKWIAMGWAALLWLQISPAESGSVFSSLQSPVWGLFLFLFHQHRRQHCYCLLMHYFALFSCGRQQQQVVAQADGVARAWQWASVQHTNLFFFAVCGELKIHKFPTATAAR